MLLIIFLIFISVGNNLKTSNFVTLIKVFIKRIPDLKDNFKCEE